MEEFWYWQRNSLSSISFCLVERHDTSWLQWGWHSLSARKENVKSFFYFRFFWTRSGESKTDACLFFKGPTAHIFSLYWDSKKKETLMRNGDQGRLNISRVILSCGRCTIPHHRAKRQPGRAEETLLKHWVNIHGLINLCVLLPRSWLQADSTM